MQLSEIPFYDAFLSYSSKDQRWVERLANKLKEDGFDVFYDHWCISGGQNIPKTIETGLEKSLKIIFVLTPDSVKSKWTEFETKYDWDKIYLNDSDKLFPLLIKKCEIPKRISNKKLFDFTKGSFEENYKLLKENLLSLQSLSIGPYQLTDDAYFRKQFIDFICKKIKFYYAYSDEQINKNRLIFDELTTNAFIHPKVQNNIVDVTYRINNHSINLEVRDKGNGFDIAKKIKKAKSFIKKLPLFSKGRGIYTVFFACDLLGNKSDETGHCITATIFKEPVLITTFNGRGELIAREKSKYIKFTSKDLTIIRVNETSIDSSNAKFFEKVLFSYVLNESVKKLIIDLNSAEYITSIGSGVLIAAYREFCKNGSKASNFALVIPSHEIYDLYSLLQFDSVFLIFDSLDRALEYFDSQQTDDPQRDLFKNLFLPKL